MLVLFFVAVFLAFYGKIKSSNMKYKIRKYDFENRQPGGGVGFSSFEAAERMRQTEKSAESLNTIGSASIAASLILFFYNFFSGGFDIPKASELSFNSKFIFGFFFHFLVNPLFWLGGVVGLIMFLVGRSRQRENKSNGSSIKWVGVICLVATVLCVVYLSYNDAQLL